MLHPAAARAFSAAFFASAWVEPAPVKIPQPGGQVPRAFVVHVHFGFLHSTGLGRRGGIGRGLSHHSTSGPVVYCPTQYPTATPAAMTVHPAAMTGFETTTSPTPTAAGASSSPVCSPDGSWKLIGLFSTYLYWFTPPENPSGSRVRNLAVPGE